MRSTVPFLLTLLCLPARVFAGPSHSVDTNFVYAPGPEGSSGVTAVALNPLSGAVLAIGSFNTFHGLPATNIVRLTSSGAVDPTFKVGTGGQPVFLLPGVPSAPQLQAVAVDASGRTYVGGAFWNWNGSGLSNFVRLTDAGAVDPTFHPSGLQGGVGQIVPLADGKLIVVSATSGGNFTPKRKSGFGRLNADGTVDATFPDNALGDLVGLTLGGPATRRIAVQADGKLLALLNGAKSGAAAQGIVRLHADGTVDSAFHAAATQGAGSLDWITVQPDGKILASGGVSGYDGHAVKQIFRLNADGTFDSSFANQVAVSKVPWALPLPDGRVIASGVGWVPTPAPSLALAIVRLNPDGTYDNNFVIPSSVDAGLTTVWSSSAAPAVQPDGLLVAPGVVASAPPFRIYSGVFRLNPGGKPEIPFILAPPMAQTNTAGTTATFAVQAGGTPPFHYQWKFNGAPLDGATSPTLTLKNVSANSAGDYSCDVSNDAGTTPSTPAHLTVLPAILGHIAQSSSYPEGVGPLFGSKVDGLSLASDDSVLIFGQFNQFRGLNATNLCRLLPDGTLDSGLLVKADTQDEITLAARQRNGKIVAFGRVHSATVFHTQLARFNADGSNDASYDPGVSAASAIALQSDDRVLVAGATLVQVPNSSYPLIRINGDGTQDKTFQPGAAAGPGQPSLAFFSPKAVKVLANDKILLQAGWQDATRKPQFGLLLLNSNGTLDPAYAPVVGAYLVDALPDGTAYAVVAGSTGSVIKRFSPAGAPDPSFNSPVIANLVDRPPYSGAALADGRVLLIGPFDLKVGHALFAADGSLASSYDSQPLTGGTYLYNAAVTSDGRQFIAGQFTKVAGNSVIGFAEFNRLFSGAPAKPPTLVAPVLENGKLNFTFPAGFTLESSLALGAGGWSTLSSQSPVSVPATATAQFFRLVRLP